MVSELCSAAMLLPCAATCPSVVARAAAVARGAIASASALLSSFCGDPVVQQLDGGCVVAVPRTSGILPVTDPSNMFTYVFTGLRRRPRS